MDECQWHFGKKVKVAAVAIGACVVLLLVAPVVSALMGGEGLMWSVSPNGPVRLDVCWENPSRAMPQPANGRAWP